ncbi:imidazole glycerol phosphate synthase subunit HisH [Magnetospirillum sp. 15-1]|uniref:imidazole glycerol phosphate synthase subunit HisH n=1 Tax=Magnetospirillum sp. 15-1 TaxID=1979370 RepID=UPI000BBC0FD0|nr:imidazole glycerol phosphate synthase subunit HisH [Magnetospirillum sp. 15-1]
MITIIDSGICNIGSVLTALERVGASFAVTTDPARVAQAKSLLLPGVGAFADGMEALRRHGLVDPIRAHAAQGKPILGICLGMQLLAESSEEFGTHQGLGLIPGHVRKLPAAPGLRVPNMGWCDMQVQPGARLFAGLEPGASFYFVHSYAMDCADPRHSVGTIAFGPRPVTVAVERDNIFGAQFHPEKSQDTGLAFLANFVNTVDAQ